MTQLWVNVGGVKSNRQLGLDLPTIIVDSPGEKRQLYHTVKIKGPSVLLSGDGGPAYTWLETDAPIEGFRRNE